MRRKWQVRFRPGEKVNLTACCQEVDRVGLEIIGKNSKFNPRTNAFLDTLANFAISTHWLDEAEIGYRSRGQTSLGMGRVRQVQNLSWTKFLQKPNIKAKKNAQKPNDRASFYELYRVQKSEVFSQ